MQMLGSKSGGTTASFDQTPLAEQSTHHSSDIPGAAPAATSEKSSNDDFDDDIPF